ncbi:MAG: hypothetical protein QG577_1036 [Thermodesulfobacteriota bacterium]|nr:hypothetical protein [Thermodesulfobacteriota bacterium]
MDLLPFFSGQISYRIVGPASLYNRTRFFSGKQPVHVATEISERVPK